MNKRQVIFGSLVVLALALALFFTFQIEDCPNFECFQSHMAECSKATYINEEPEASWGYEIVGVSKDSCEIEVSLLNAKDGELGLREFEGNSMSCFYDLGIIAYPEKDLDSCTGELKEDLQEIIIEKLYKYVVLNLGEIKEEIGI